ncbi:MAG: hypothetical protein ACOX6Z_05890 [Dethiobacteria bacterium]|jgi:hypothetical protein
MGGHMGILAAGEVAVATTNRHYQYQSLSAVDKILAGGKNLTFLIPCYNRVIVPEFLFLS